MAATKGDDIRNRIRKNKLSYVWLIEQLKLKGIVTDKTELSSVVAGTRHGTKADAILDVSCIILDKYEKGHVEVSP